MAESETYTETDNMYSKTCLTWTRAYVDSPPTLDKILCSTVQTEFCPFTSSYMDELVMRGWWRLTNVP